MRNGIVIAAVAGVVAGCEDEGVLCTEGAVPSVVVELIDEDYGPIGDAEVVFSVDGGAPSACEPGNEGWTCGWEREGTFTITASAPGFADATDEIVVGADECHVVTQDLTLQLDRTCDDRPVPAVVAVVKQPDGSSVPAAEVVWAPSYTSVEQLPCDRLDERRYACAWDYESDRIDVFVYADGFHHVFTEEIALTHDVECGDVVTETIDVVMKPLQ